MTKYIYTDGQKAVSLTGEEGWTYFTTYPRTNEVEQYSKVAAAFRAYNIKANTIANMPLVLYKGDEEFDSSATWENKVGFLPNPSELLRLVVLSLIATNTAYNLRTADALGYKTKGLYHAVAYAFYPWTIPQTGELDYIERRIGSQIERYTPDDKRLVRLWRLDHTTEVLPSQNTEAKAIMSSAGQVLYADMWIQHFYQSGGVPPTLIAMKGLVDKDSKEDKEKSWSEWLLGIGRSFMRRARIYNADGMDIKQMGSSLTDLKNNEIYQQALANIAMGTGMPLSLLLANSANYATAQAEKATWLETDIIPYCNWLAYEYNRQVFDPIGLRLEFKPETLDPEQEDETQRAQAFSVYGDSFGKYPTYELWKGMAETLGLEISDGLDAAAKAYYAEKKENAARVQEQMQPIPPQEDQPQEEEAPAEVPTFSKWIPSIDELQELKTWRKVARTIFRKGSSLDFIYQPHYGGVPANVQSLIVERLPFAKSLDEIDGIFEVEQFIETETPAPVYETNPDIKLLAEALNRLAESNKTPVEVKEPIPPVTNFNLSLTTQMPEQGAPVTNITNQILPAPVNNEVTVQPAPVEVKAENNITVQPADVKIPKPVRELQKVSRHKKGDEKGLIDKTETSIEYEE